MLRISATLVHDLSHVYQSYWFAHICNRNYPADVIIIIATIIIIIRPRVWRGPKIDAKERETETEGERDRANARSARASPAMRCEATAAVLGLVARCRVRARNLRDSPTASSTDPRFGEIRRGSRSGSIYKVVNIEPAGYIGCVHSHPRLTPAGDDVRLRSDPRRLSLFLSRPKERKS